MNDDGMVWERVACSNALITTDVSTMSKTITVSAIIYNAKYDCGYSKPYFEELTTLPFKEWLKNKNEQRTLEQGETCIETEDEFDVHTLEIEVNNGIH